MAGGSAPLFTASGGIEMSRIATAMTRAGTILSSAELFREDNHPWVEDLVDEPKSQLDEPRLIDVAPRPAPESAPTRLRSEPGSIESAIESPVASLRAEIRQQLAGLVERVFLPLSGQPRQCVGFSAVDTDATAGMITAAAAQLLSERTTATVCVVDAQLTSPSLHQHFGVANTAGLADAFATGAAPADSARRLRRNLWIVTAGLEPTRAGASPDAMRLQMARFIAEFDYVLVNMEPTVQRGDAGRFAAVMDGVILVVDAESTRREAGRRAAEILREAGATMIGAVLTNRRFPIPERIYRRL
jgi:Mrp family chromosome partitioning ATPase